MAKMKPPFGRLHFAQRMSIGWIRGVLTALPGMGQRPASGRMRQLSKLHPMRFGLRLHFLMLLAATIVLGSAAGYRFYAWYSGEVTLVLGQRYAERNVLYEKARVLGMVTREVTLVQKMANSQSLRAWTANESNPDLRRYAIADLEEYRAFLRDRSYSFAHAASGNYYFNDARRGDNLYKPRYTLDPANPKDAWFYLTLRDVEDTRLNVDTDRHTGLTKVWINSVVRNDRGEAVAVASSGVDLTDFLRSVVNSNLPGATTILFDRGGAIQGHPDVAQIDFASLRKAAGQEAQHTLFDLVADPDDRAALRRAMGQLAGGKSDVETLDLVVQGQRKLIGLAWLPQIQWYILTMTPPTQAGSDTELASAVLWLITALDLVLLAAVLILQKTVVNRVIRLDAAAKALGDAEGGQRVDIPADPRDDEIGRLTRTFRAMAERIASHTEDLERQVEERTDKLERLAHTDFLTGTMNRRGMMQRLEAERNRLGRNGGLLAVMLVDVDHFKRVNDTWGHAVGDQALTLVAKVLQRTVRDYDLVARWGGEEFLVALFGLKHFNEMERVADKLLAAVRDSVLECGENRLTLTYSIGGVLASPQANLDMIIHQADEALYRAKNEGRNRAVLDCLLLGDDECDCRTRCGPGKECPVDLDQPESAG